MNEILLILTTLNLKSSDHTSVLRSSVPLKAKNNPKHYPLHGHPTAQECVMLLSVCFCDSHRKCLSFNLSGRKGAAASHASDLQLRQEEIFAGFVKLCLSAVSQKESSPLGKAGGCLPVQP